MMLSSSLPPHSSSICRQTICNAKDHCQKEKNTVDVFPDAVNKMYNASVLFAPETSDCRHVAGEVHGKGKKCISCVVGIQIPDKKGGGESSRICK